MNRDEYYNALASVNSLQHHGVKGMHWGVRRYQNADGSLTAAGIKRYSTMSPKKLEKTLQKEIRKERGKQYGFSNKYMYDLTIGENSKKAIDTLNQKIKDYKNSEEYKNALKRAKEVDKKWKDVESGKMTEEQWNGEHSKAYGYFDKKSAELGQTKTLSNVKKGFEYSKQFSEGHGKEISVAYLRDLGYDKAGAKYIAELLAKNRKSLY